MRKSKFPSPAVFAFLAPNLAGFLLFTLLPVVLSLWMAFTNWSLKPAVKYRFLGLRNFNDLLGVRPLNGPHPGLGWAYLACAIGLLVGAAGLLWANLSRWRGARFGGVILAVLGTLTILLDINISPSAGVLIGGFAALVCGIAAMSSDADWRPGIGTIPAVLVTIGAAGLWLLNRPMWDAYEARDERFWQFLYNTIYLMLGIPFAIAGSLALALLVNDELPARGAGGARGWTRRIIASASWMLGGVAAFAIFWMVGRHNFAALAGILFFVAALGTFFGVVAFRTLFYLPTFTAGVALMILWKALYNPDVGPINAALSGFFSAFGSDAKPPNWLGSVTWAKPALVFMGVWTAIGGTNMLLYLAGLSNVPRELLDAAEVDGANRWARFRHVTWPQLAPTTFFISIISIIGGFQGGFEQARVMTGGGPAGSTTTLSYYIYNKAFQELDLGYAAAISWVLFAVIFTATALNWRFGKELEVGS